MFKTEDGINFLFCQQCFIHVTSETSKVANSLTNTWPALIWCMIQNDNIITNYGVEFIWKFTPIPWRYWWIEEYTTIHPDNIIISLSQIDLTLVPLFES
jgi:hypothetical protein